MSISKAEIQKQIDECLKAISAVRNGQVVRYRERQVTRADLDALHRDLAFWERRLAGNKPARVKFV